MAQRSQHLRIRGILCTVAEGADRPGVGVFRHGVASGDPLMDRVVLWTRVTASLPVMVEWTLARDEGLLDVVASGVADATSDGDGTVHVDATGLDPATTYHYGFRTLGASSPIGRTRTLPTVTDHVRFAVVSCAKFNAGFFNAYARVADRADLDFVLHLGDYIYEASNTPPKSQTPGADVGRPFDPADECRTLAEYRTRYRQYHDDADVQRLHAAHPVIATLDDHEFADGAWRNGAAEHRPEHGEWADRRAQAFRAREEWLPVRRIDAGDPERVWRRVAIGGLADLFLMDTRTLRDEPQAEPAMSDPDRSALGREQRDWLLAELTESRATWRLLANPSVMGHTWNPVLPDDVRAALRRVKLIADDMQGPDFDQWDGYPAERDALLDHVLEQGVDNVVVLSGDIHVSVALELHRSPFEVTERAVAVEFVTPSVTSQNLDDKMGWPRHDPRSRALAERAVEILPHWSWADLDSHGYVVIDVDVERVTAEWWHVDTVIEASVAEECAAAFAVASGTPAIMQLHADRP
jgi:alkaline phosphatase D